jgi:threonylcarbamoyladenosine tRNA methylthiotransferase MtaB
MKTVKFFTLGCKVNQYETEQIREGLLSAGFKDVGSLQKADNYVINTCTVTSAADRKSRYFINFARRNNPAAKIIVTGCYAQLDAREISRIKGVTRVVRNEDKLSLSRLLGSRGNEGRSLCQGINNFSGHARAFLKIQDGCDNRCSYCKVPLVRGRSRSRSLKDIIREAHKLIENGFQEITLCGICLGSYGRDLKPKIGLLDILRPLEKIIGLMRIRLSSIEAGDVSQGLLRVMAKSKKLCRHLHIPLQSGDDTILKRMNRSYLSSDYLQLIRRIRLLIPEIAITTDVMVGFPGEGEVNFRNTLSLVKKISPAKVHIFPYSQRRGTAAGIFKDQVGIGEAKGRVRRLTELSQACALNFKKQFLGKEMQVLIEGRDKKEARYWQGHTDNYIKILAGSKKNFKNKFILVRLKKAMQDHVLAYFC